MVIAFIKLISNTGNAYFYFMCFKYDIVSMGYTHGSHSWVFKTLVK